MERLFTIGKHLATLTGVSTLIAALSGFSLIHWINISFLTALITFVLSGIYYLKCQNAFVIFTNSTKKFLYAIIELFSHSDHTRQRQVLNARETASPDLLNGSELFVASALTMVADFAIICLF